MLRLLVIHGDEEQVFPLPESEARLGSAPENDIVVRVKGVSRRHAVLRRLPEGIEVVDAGSTNKLIVEGQRVTRTVLTPGLRVQLGAAWLGVEEASSSESALAVLLQTTSEGRPCPPTVTAGVRPGADPRGLSPTDAAFALACHIAQVGVGLPGKRADLLLRIRATLGAEAFGSFERTRRGTLRLLEGQGDFSREDTKALGALAEGARSEAPKSMVLKRLGRLLLAGRDSWFLAARLPEEPLARDPWRKDFLRFFAHQFFTPVRNLDDLNASEVARVLALARGNKKRAAELLGISRGTLYKLLSRRSSPKR